jgi:hypothetical protein
VRPSSLRHWAGRTAYDAGSPIEAVARLLGHRSLDATAEDIALTWRDGSPANVTGPDARTVGSRPGDIPLNQPGAASLLAHERC